MTSWNYRVLRRSISRPEDPEDFEYAIYEVYYDELGNPIMCSEDPVFPFGNTQKDLFDDLKNYSDSFNMPCLDWHFFDIKKN